MITSLKRGSTVFPLVARTWAFQSSIWNTSPSIQAKYLSSNHIWEPTTIFNVAAMSHANTATLQPSISRGEPGRAAARGGRVGGVSLPWAARRLPLRLGETAGSRCSAVRLECGGARYQQRARGRRRRRRGMRAARRSPCGRGGTAGTRCGEVLLKRVRAEARCQQRSARGGGGGGEWGREPEAIPPIYFWHWVGGGRLADRSGFERAILGATRTTTTTVAFAESRGGGGQRGQGKSGRPQ